MARQHMPIRPKEGPKRPPLGQPANFEGKQTEAAAWGVACTDQKNDEANKKGTMARPQAIFHRAQNTGTRQCTI